MSRIVWDHTGQRQFEVGVDRGVLYTPGSSPVAWNGLTAVLEKRDGEGTKPYYLEGVKYFDDPSLSDYRATLQAVTYPDEFSSFDGVQDLGNGLYFENQIPKTFGLSYRTLLGNNLEGSDLGYRIHLLYNLTATPSNRNYSSISTEVRPTEFSWDISGVPEIVAGRRPTSHVVLDSTKMNPRLLQKMEDILYGNALINGSLPPLSTVVSLIVDWALIAIVDNGDGTWSATGPEEYITMLDAKTFQIVSTAASYIDPDTYTITSSTSEEE